MPTELRDEIRKRMRQARRNLDPDTRQRAAELLCQRLCAQPFYQTAKNLAAYLACDGEIETKQIIHRAWEDGKQVHLPVVRPDRSLAFATYTENSTMKKNRFGIAEPSGENVSLIRPAALDLVLVPLVAFDRQLNRLGMGAGYYDRAFGYLNQGANQQSALVGLAFNIQLENALPAREWDVPARLVITEQTMYSRGII